MRRTSIVTAIALLVSSFIGLTGLSGSSSPAAAAVFDASAYPLKFTTPVGITPSGATGTPGAAGQVFRYNAVTTIDGTVIDAVVQVVSITNATLDRLDGGAGGAVATPPPGSAQSIDDLLLPNIGTSAGAGIVTLDVSFYEGGTYTGAGSGVPVTLANVKLNTYDIDSGGTNHQYVDFRGFQSYLNYTGEAPNGVTITNQTDGYVRFQAANSTAATATNGSYSRARVQVNYDRVTTLQVRMGIIASGGGFFALDFSAGGIWTTNGTTVVTPTGGSNPNNRPPTTADVSLLRATEDISTALTAADFPYTDLDNNAMASVRIVTVPLVTDGTLEYFNGTSWQTVTAGSVISTTDLDLGKLRITPITPSGSFTFQVNDGLVYSGTSTLSYTSPPSAQTITFVNPGTRGPGVTIASGATASSGLTPTLTSLTTSVCTVSGLSIITSALPSGVSTAICVITATQAGDATYGRADAVTQQFSVSSLLAQTITFADPGDQAFSSTPIVTGVAATPSGLPVTLSTLTPSVCTVSGGSITPVVPGVCSVRATQAGNGTYAAAPPVTQTFTLTLPAQTITFTQPADQVVNGGPLVVAPTASSGLTPVLTSDTPAVCSVSGMSITFVSVGECTITANQAGNSSFAAAAPVSRSFDIDLVAQSITFTQPADQQFVDGPLVVAPTASSGLTPVLTSDTPAVCSVTGMSIGFVAPGECTITANQTGNATYAAASPVSRSFDIGLQSQTITFGQPADQLVNGGPLVVTPTASSGLTPVLTSDTTAVCSVTGMSITFITPGECTITATQAGNSSYSAAAPVSRSFDIDLVAQTITFSQPADQQFVDGPLVVAPTASSGLTPVLSSSTPSTCAVTGMSISFIDAGTCTITANQAGNDTYAAAAPVSRSFDIGLQPQTITFAQPLDQDMDGGPLVVAPTASSGLTPVLTSDTTAVCSVSGMSITFISAGTCTITANQAGNSSYSAAAPVSRSFDIDLVAQTITFTQPAGQLVNDGPLVVAPTASSGLTPVLTSDTTAVCSVTGMSITFLSAGTCTITANQAGNDTYAAAAPVSHSFDIDLVAQSITFTQPADQQFVDGPLVVAPTASSGLTPVLTSDTTAVCSVTGMSITFLASGECTITANQAGDDTYAAAAPVSRTFDIGLQPQTITFTQPSDQLVNGGPLVVAPTASSGLTPELTSDTTAVCSVTGMSITFLAAGECIITADQAGNSSYSAAAPVSRSFDIDLVAQTITFTQPADQAVNGGPLVVAPTASSGLTPSLASNTTAVCSVTGMSITFITTGTCSVTATQSGDAIHSAATPVTRSFDIDLLAQTITFTQPADQQFVDGPLVVAPTASSGLTPVLNSTTSATCSVTGMSISFVSAGTCTITATQAGNAIYAAAAPVTRSFDIGVQPQTITFAQPADQLVNGGPLVVAPTASSGLTPVLTSDTTAVCSVTGMSITFLAAGECTLTANQAGNSSYAAAAPVSRSFDIDLVGQTITFTQPADQLINGGPLVVAPTASSGLTPVLTSDTTAVCSVTGMSITFISAGTCIITADQAGNSTYTAAAPVTRSFDIDLLAQTITFTQPSDQVMGGGPLVVAPTASSGLTPVLSSSTTAVCSVTGMSISFIRAGTCTITANQAGNAIYAAAAPVSRSFDIDLVAQTINFAAIADQLISDGSVAVAPSASSGLTPALTSDTSAVCLVSGFTISFVTTGQCTVTASQAGDSTYSAATPVTRSFDIAVLGQTITYPQRSDVSLDDPAVVLVATTDAAGLTVTLTSETTAVCTVAGFTVSFVSPGLCTVTATQSGDATYTAATPVARSFRVLEITTRILSPMDTGHAASRQLEVAGAAGGGVWATTSTLPAGLELDEATGVLSGTPTVSSTDYYTFLYTESGVTHDASVLLEIRAAANLAHTGTDALLPAGTAILLLLLGGIVLAFAARKRHHRA